LSEIPYKFSILSYKKSDKITWNLRLLINKKPCEHYVSKNLFDSIVEMLNTENEDANKFNVFNIVCLVCKYVLQSKEENKIFIPHLKK
jgi:hypothetical protein